ncbi:flagellar hook-length control protein FliK [Clostridium sp. BL-8]|uniref:flagellar hook-length control protein FliK n=1 Tax=Clostridium sp. BL-8 TaxID=349938 RepID=UPI00098C5AE9|nr:flagellar hook-length control protein FliK [Clostridium sp. BL-8]OOM79938.1 flagellar hook-length control protein FliK [Clostridium sp. BL-8]
MATATKISYDYAQNSIVSSSVNSTTSSSNKPTRNKDFQETLSSQKNEKQVDNKNISTKPNDKDSNTKVNDKDDRSKVDNNEQSNQVEDKDSSKIDELKDKLEELEKESKSASKDDVNDILNELMNLLAQLGIDQKDITSTDGKVNSDMLQKLIEGAGKDTSSSSDNLNSVMDNLMKLLQTDSVKDKLDTNSLSLVQNILKNINDDSNTSKEVKDGIKDLMSEISKLIDDKQNQNGKVLTLEDLLNKNYSQSNNENSTENESSNSNTTLENKESSKEDKFLNSLATDDKTGDTTNKINLFVSRNQLIQNQDAVVTETSKNLTVNKATFANDIVQDVNFMSTNGLKELTVKINPGNLGEVTISLTQEDGVMKANLKANSKDTTSLLMQNLTDIKNQINDKNIKISEINIELYQEDTTFFKNGNFDGQFAQQQQNSNHANESGNDKISDEDYLADSNTQAIDNGNVNFLA